MITKVLASVGATGVVAGAITGVYLYTRQDTKTAKATTTTISELIKQHATGKTFLNSTTKSTGDWKPIWAKYRTANSSKGQTKGSDKWGLSDWASQHSNNSSVPESFIILCGEKVNTEVTGIEDEKYTEFIDWCSR